MSLSAFFRRLACHHDRAQHLYCVSEHPKGILGARPSMWRCIDCGAEIFRDVFNGSADR